MPEPTSLLPIASADGVPRVAECYHVERGLAVQKEVLDSGEPARTWAVLHLVSGRRVAGRMRTKRHARALQVQLLALEIDWTKKATTAWLHQTRRLALPVVRAAELKENGYA